MGCCGNLCGRQKFKWGSIFCFINRKELNSTLIFINNRNFNHMLIGNFPLLLRKLAAAFVYVW